MDKVNVCISMERLQQLIRAEHDANHIKALISDKYEKYENFDREDLKFLHTMYCAKKED